MNTRRKDNITLMRALRAKADEMAKDNPKGSVVIRELSDSINENPDCHVWSVKTTVEGLWEQVNEVLSDLVFDTTYPYASEAQVITPTGDEAIYVVQGVLAKDLDGMINQTEEYRHE